MKKPPPELHTDRTRRRLEDFDKRLRQIAKDIKRLIEIAKK